MWGMVWMLAGCVLILGVTGTDRLYRSGRRICSSSGQTGAVPVTQSFIQPVYNPLITLCEGNRVCSTYRTTYKISYRQVTRRTSLPLHTCCPGWRRTELHPHCSKASCASPCQNGGTCVAYNQCECSAGWTGKLCQTDVDECAAGSHCCSQTCKNTIGSFHCACREGFSLSGDGKSCHKVETPTVPPPPPLPPTVSRPGVPDSVQEEMQELRNKIKVLEQKLQLVLAPFQGFSTASPEDGGLGPLTLLTHSFQQLDRIDSLSEQISFLEERLETCSCRNEV